MQLDVTIWSNLLKLEAEVKRRGGLLTRRMIKDTFQRSEHDARFLHDALRYKDIIAMRMQSTDAESGSVCAVMADVHIPYQDVLAVETMLNYLDRIQPEYIVVLGDLIDFYQLSRYIKNPKNKSISYEVKETKKFLTELRERYKSAKIHYLFGNHENRANNFLMQSAPQVYDLLENFLPKLMGVYDLGIEVHDRPFKIGKMNFLHGHEKGSGSYNPEYVTNVIFNYVYDHFCVGHFHRTQDKTFKRIDGSIFIGAAVGYLGGEMEYATLNKWNHGFCTLTFAENGKFSPRNYRIYNGQIF